MELRLAEVFASLRSAQAQADAPLCAYVYDLAALRRHAANLADSMPDGCELFYAIKANSDRPILQTLAPLVAGFEVSSGGELAWVREHFAEVPVIFSGPGKLDQELRQAIEQDVDCLHVESLHELQRLADIAGRAGRTAPVSLRINLTVDKLAETGLMMGGKPTPFGIPAQQLRECLEWLRAHPEIHLRGFHFHLLSHQLDAAAHLQLVAAYLAQTRRWCEDYGLDIDHINVGGGIGVNYRQPDRQFDWPAFSAGLATLLSECGMPGVGVRFEFGRYITAACGYYAMQVIDIKRSHSKTFVVGRGGTHHFRTPYAQGHSHPFHVLPIDAWPYPFPRPEASNDTVSIVGQLCTPKDVLAFDAPVESVRCNDVLVFPYAGAYAWHISHHDFLRHPHPAQWYLPVE
ncbi:MAG TPA: type III PLP-dependent enzyme [Thiobacillus sp.]|nr:MAG: diaminopimelate decarboxylase [Hydrogenophilales bacterium 28-61-11]OYZ57800.1 MAG: diaminopimelate decarboxylase [Hydrogenophilales bacterium 16-61-112]OZA48630.1 MAG: diaminopimelate decarboxylase [Hydrogenophilales bacterium 17-61-76]HQT69899.1 type III PLP-dependent enzyme [Thiobacillus sp.]